jgi:hypothetical protein
MTGRRALVGLTWLLAAAGAVVLVATGIAMEQDANGSLNVLWIFAFGALGLDVVVFATVGAIVAIRKPGNVVGLVLIGSSLLIVLTFCGFLFGGRQTAYHGPDDPLAVAASFVGSVTIFPTLIFVGPVLALVFPDGRLPGPRWRWPVAGIAAAVVGGTILSLARPGPFNTDLANNPFGIEGAAWVEPVATLGSALAAISFPAAMMLAVAAVIARFRRGHGVERQQLKWFLAANAIVLVLLTVITNEPGLSVTLLDVVAFLSLSLPPIAVGIAVLRYRLYEIDRIISRTIGWALVSGALAAVFATGVLALQALLSDVTQGQTLAVAASTLVAFALFQPVRRRVQRAVDHRFDRARYDGERTAAAFAERLRHEVDLDTLAVELEQTASLAVRPTVAAIWLPERGAR